MQLHEHLRDIRLKNHLSQIQMSNILSVGYSTYKRYENGERKPDIDTIIKLCNYFKLSSDSILNIEL